MSESPRAQIVKGRLEGARFLLDPRVRRLFSLLNGDGEETRVVGGAVRNALIGAPVHEVDFATTATPDVVMARAAAARVKTAPTGLDHGTVTLIIDGAPFEITTLREDVDTDGRRAKVRFSRSFEEDAMRRDFTFNALFVDANGALFDYTEGLADLARRCVRFIGEPRLRIREDYLRSLRFFRFHSVLGEGPADPQALAAIIAERDGLTLLSRERVRAEILKSLDGRRAADAAGLMSDAGVLQGLFGGIAVPARLARAMAIESAAQAPPDALLRLSALAVLVAEDAERLREALRLSNAERERLAACATTLVSLHGRDQPPGPGDLRAMLFLRGRRACMDALTLAHAESRAGTDDHAWIGARRFVRDTPEPSAPFSGADIVARGVPAGRLVGETLKKLQARWIRAGFPKEAVEIARLIDEALAEARQSESRGSR